MSGACLAVTVLAGWVAADEWQYDRYERERYDLARGAAHVADDGTPVVRVRGERIGTVDLPWSWFEPERGETVEVKVNPRDPSDYLFADEHAQPWRTTFVALGWLGATLAAAGVAALLVRRGRLDTAPALAAAAPPVEPGVPPVVTPPERLTEQPPPVGAAFLAAGAAGLLVVLAVPTGISEPEYRRVEGRVVDGAGSLDVEYDDPREETRRTRPLTSREAAGLRPGDRYAWDVAVDADGGQFGPNAPNLWLGTGWLAVVGARRWRWRRALARAVVTPPHAEPLAAWMRVHLGRTWLALAPYGSERVRDVRLVPLDHMSPAPEAVASILWVRGPLRRGAAVVVHTRDGAALWPVGRVRGAVTAAMLGPSPWAPEPRGEAQRGA